MTKSTKARTAPKKKRTVKATKTAVAKVPAGKTEQRRALLPPPPPAPNTKVDRKKRTGPQADLQRAEIALARATEVYTKQAEHPGNTDLIDFRPLYERLVELDQVHREKGFAKSTRDLAYDWAGFCKDARELETDIQQAVIDALKAKADRMAWTGNFNPQSEADKAALQEAYDEADEKPHLAGKIWGWAWLVNKKLPAHGCSDPNDQHRGGRQSGGNRRSGRR